MTMDLILTVNFSYYSVVVMNVWPDQQQGHWSVQRRCWELQAYRSRIQSCFINRNCRQYAHVGFWWSMCWYLYPEIYTNVMLIISVSNLEMFSMQISIEWAIALEQYETLLWMFCTISYRSNVTACHIRSGVGGGWGGRTLCEHSTWNSG